MIRLGRSCLTISFPENQAAPFISRGVPIRGRTPSAHHRPAQGADLAQAEKSRAAQEIGREDAVQQGPVEPVHRRRPQPDIDVAAELIASQGLGAILARLAGIDHRIPQGRHIPQPEIQALRSDGRENMRCFAHQRQAGGGERSTDMPVIGKVPARRRRSSWRPRCDCACRSIRKARVASPSPVRVSASSGLVTQTRLERRPGRGTSVNGPWRVWNSVEVSRCGRS